MKRLSQAARRLRAPAAGAMLALCVIAVFSVVTAKRLPMIAEAAAPARTAAYAPSYTVREGPEVVLVFIGASFCGAHKRPGFAETVEWAKVELARRTVAQGKQFSAVGISLDWKPAEALAFLERFGSFDQVSLGRNWTNDSALRYIWKDLPGEPVVPQILVIERYVETTPSIDIRDERVVKRIAGADQIATWVEQGAPL